MHLTTYQKAKDYLLLSFLKAWFLGNAIRLLLVTSFKAVSLMTFASLFAIVQPAHSFH